MADPEKQMVVEDGSDHEDLSSDDEAPGAGSHANASSLLQDPAVMAALQGKLGAMVGTPSGYVASLPAPVRRRIKALKKLQLEATKIEAKFYEEVRHANLLKWGKFTHVCYVQVHQLECKYHELYTPIYSKRTTITTGDHEPTDAESEWPSDSEDEDEGLSEEVEKFTFYIKCLFFVFTFLLLVWTFFSSGKRESEVG